MPQHKSAKKRIRQDAVRRARNRAVKSRVQRAVRKLHEAKAEEMPAVLKETVSVLDNARRKGVLKDGTVNRKKSRLTRWVNKQSSASS